MRIDYVEVVGVVPTDFGLVLSSAATPGRRYWTTVQETASLLGLRIHGAVIGQGKSKIPPLRGREGAGLFPCWTTGDLPTLNHYVLQS